MSRYGVEFTLGQYQHGIRVPVLYRYVDPRSPSNYRVVTSSRIVAGTGIPASTLHRFATGEYIPSAKSLKKIADFERRVKYAWLRAAGVSKTEAFIARDYTFSRVIDICETYRKQAHLHALQTLKIEWMRSMGVAPEVVDATKDAPIEAVETVAREFGGTDIPAKEKNFPTREVARLTLYIMAGFAHSPLQVSDVEDIYGDADDSQAPLDDLYDIYAAGDIDE